MKCLLPLILLVPLTSFGKTLNCKTSQNGQEILLDLSPYLRQKININIIDGSTINGFEFVGIQKVMKTPQADYSLYQNEKEYNLINAKGELYTLITYEKEYLPEIPSRVPSRIPNPRQIDDLITSSNKCHTRVCDYQVPVVKKNIHVEIYKDENLEYEFKNCSLY